MNHNYRVPAALAAFALVASLLVVPLMSSASAAATGAAQRAGVSTQCVHTRASLARARAYKAKALRVLLKSRAVLAKATKAHRPAQARKARKAVRKAAASYRTWNSVARARHQRARAICVTAAPKTPQTTARDAGAMLGLLAKGAGNDNQTAAISSTQFTSVLDRLLPGLGSQLDPAALISMLAGFNDVGSLGFGGAQSLLGSTFSSGDVVSLLLGAADPSVLQNLAQSVLGQLGSLTGQSVPASFDPASLLNLFSGMFGNLDPTQLGQLLGLLTTALGSGSDALDPAQLTSLLDSLVPGGAGMFDPSELTQILAGLNGGGLSAASLADLLGGAFSVDQIQSVLAGSASQDLLGGVIAQIMAELGTGGEGGLQMPGSLDSGQLTGLVSTVTGVLTSILGGLDGVLDGGLDGGTDGGADGGIPVVCDLLPLPGLC